MNRVEYAGYVLARLAEALAVACGAAFLAHALQRVGWLPPIHPALAGPMSSRHPWAAHALVRIGWWAWPACWAALAHLILGPKQSEPVYLRLPGAMYAYAGVKVDRNAGCRGGFVTGATGSGKTLACIIPRLHSLCINERGVERREWSGSQAQLGFEALKRERRARSRDLNDQIARLATARGEAESHHNILCANMMCNDSTDGESGAAGGVALIDAETGSLRARLERLDRELQDASDAHRAIRYRVAPWGGFICGEKGNEWQAVESLLRRHGREEDICILRTRPSGAPQSWSPLVRLNLVSMDEIPADTLAKMIVDTGLAVEEAQTSDEFFVPQARDKIAWGIRLLRAAKAVAPRTCRGPGLGLVTLFDILTVHESYRRYMTQRCDEQPQLLTSSAFAEARFQLENNYWSQPPDQLGGVRSTIYNFLVPFSEPEIAEVFCSDSTFDLRDIQLGKVVCLAIPQRFALQRRYVATLLKTLAYQIILERFDRRGDHPEWLNRNVILVEQDEWQRHAVRADFEADVVREAQGAVYAATQSQNAVWLKFGGRERAAPLLANLRNRWICQASTEECADESSNLVGGQVFREVSYSRGVGGRTTNVSFSERPFLPRRELRTLPPFHVVFAPAEGRWLYRKCIAMPATADGRIPPWWFGDWNPIHWAARFLGLPATIAGIRIHPGGEYVPPWRACAPLRAQLRRLWGLDGTFIILGGVRSSSALKATEARRNPNI
ncbi:MAG TPA: type IV secretory system conjugative DNA transfer family protein [Opitutaceae bacterium]|nr:type IV secretory system conjugative DNA transfer family protein [Opitutaceae bacterium]